MKKYTMMMMVFALLLGMTQCKKEITNANNDNTEGISITLKVDGSSTGSETNSGDGNRLNVYPATGAVIFTQGDKIYVGNNGKYVGTLTFENGLFQGTISGDLSTSDYLHFYFVGNKPTSPTDLAAGTTTYTVDISDQSAYLPAISYAPSKEKYSSTTTAYTAKLLNKSALVKFVTSQPTNHPITVSGLKNNVTIDFANHILTPTGTTGGITLYSASDTEKWAVLLEQTTLSGLTVSASGFEAAIDEETLPSAITNNMYYNSGVGISMTATIPVGAINGKFTINSNGDQVYFSKGNLQYKDGTGWRFAEHQYDYVGSWSTSDWVDLFGWGTWGDGKNPMNTSQDNNDYLWSSDFCGTLTNASSTGWRTMTYEEWNFLLSYRQTGTSVNGTNHARHTKATINTDGTSQCGFIIFPDNYSGGTPAGVTWGTINTSSSGWGTRCTTAGWSALEDAGCVFLPTSGERVNGTVVQNCATLGLYWYSTSYDSNYAWYLVFLNSGVNPDKYHKWRGCSVRLVCPAD